MSAVSASSGSVPLGAKIALVALGLGGMLGVLWALDLLAAAGIVLAGAVVVGLLLLGYRALLIWRRSAKSAPFVRKLLDAGRKPGAAQHQVEDLRRKFLEGIETFKRHGKDVYSLPWYLVVGEPGSGKTEAIRHSDVKFPKGLQNKLQGTGGTVNMHWWFTFHAVLLDTAGRLLFDSSSEWPDFLKLLKTARPHAPVNGMLLFIPADRLIKDSDTELEKKAEQIASQMVQVQRALGVRFPVFVIISKADLINGFREFFESINDPGLQHQMMGWSNPESIDAPYRGELIDDHFRTLTDRLRRRRLGLMMDPQVSIDPDGRPIDRLDSLFAFPEAVTRLAPRLRKYLDEVFTGDWSNKPPMLRGIYFTSSMREGAELDSDLASALGVPVDALPGGRSWRKKDKAYFLRDVFMEKVFRERGLVTPSSNAKRSHAMRRGLVYAASLLTAIVLVGFTAWAALDYQRRVGSHAALWRDAAALAEGRPLEGALIVPVEGSKRSFAYQGGVTVDLGGSTVPRALVPKRLVESAANPIEPPFLLALVRAKDPALDAGRVEAARAYVSAAVLSPMVQAARSALIDDAQSGSAPWTPEAAGALRALIALEDAQTAAQLHEWAETHLATLPLHALSNEDADRRDRLAAPDGPELIGAIKAAFPDDPSVRDAGAWGKPEERRAALRDAIQWAGTSARAAIGAPTCDSSECRELIDLIVGIERGRRDAYEALDRVRRGEVSRENGIKDAANRLTELDAQGLQARDLLNGPAGVQARAALTAWSGKVADARARLTLVRDWIGGGRLSDSPLGVAEQAVLTQLSGLGHAELRSEGRVVRVTPERLDAALARIEAGAVGGAVGDAVARAIELQEQIGSGAIQGNQFPQFMQLVMDRANAETGG